MAQTKSTRAAPAQSQSSIDPLIHAAVNRQAVEVEPAAEADPPRGTLDTQLKRLFDATCMVGVVARAIQDQQGCAEAHGVLRFAEDMLYDVESEIECSLRDAQPSCHESAAATSAQGGSDAVVEPAPAGTRDWRYMAPRGAEEALRRLESGATLAQVCGGESAPEDAIPEAIRRHLLEQQQRVVELQETLQMLADRIDEGASVAAGCARLAHVLNEGLDSHTLRKVLEEQAPVGSEEAAS